MPAELSAGTPARIGRYEVIAHLATGGMAQIYLARQSGLGSFERHVVLKTILRERAADHRFVTMFLDEAKLAATLNHQNIAQVYEVDQADGAYFMAMEYVHGENARAILESALKKGWTVPMELAVMIVSGAAAGLHHAHERKGKGGTPLNIVHRDVSPANIMVGFDGSVKVLDFGIAKAEERATKTVGGTIKGKYGYMSPEQCKGKTIDRRSDIFALGIVLYELTTLRRAFRGNDDFETMKRIVSGDVIRPSTAVEGYPRELEAIVLTALATDSNARFQTAAEMIEALDAFTQRAKLTGTGTAMGRFMTQLFGEKKEPWVEGADVDAIDESSRGGDATQVTEGVPPGDDNEQTQLVEGNPAAALEKLVPPTTPAPVAAASPVDAWRTGDAPRAATTPPPVVAARDSRPAGGFDPMTGLPLGNRAQTQPGYPAHANGDASGRWKAPPPPAEPVPATGRSQPLPPQLSFASATPSRPIAAVAPPPWETPASPPLDARDAKLGSNKNWIFLAISVVIAIAVVIAIVTSM